MAAAVLVSGQDRRGVVLASRFVVCRSLLGAALPDFIRENPQITVEVVERGAKHPYLLGNYGAC
jgi:hypothetical protein